jgi:hypothetical protein
MGTIYRAYLIALLVLCTWPLLVSADAGLTPSEAQLSVTLAEAALGRAGAWEDQARKELDKASKALSKKPKSAKAKQAVEEARKELASALAYKANMQAELQEKTLAASAIALSEVKAKPIPKGEARVYTSSDFNVFLDDYELAEKVDAYFFFNDPFDFKDKTVVLDARFDEKLPSGDTKFTMWRNFGQMPLVVSNLPHGQEIPRQQAVLLAGTITGFKKEVIAEKLVLSTLLKLTGVYICNEGQCPKERLR